MCQLPVPTVLGLTARCGTERAQAAWRALSLGNQSSPTQVADWVLREEGRLEERSEHKLCFCGTENVLSPTHMSSLALTARMTVSVWVPPKGDTGIWGPDLSVNSLSGRMTLRSTRRRGEVRCAREGSRTGDCCGQWGSSPPRDLHTSDLSYVG